MASPTSKSRGSLVPEAAVGRTKRPNSVESTSAPTVEASVRSGLLRLAEVGWRRRYLLILPIIAMIPLSLAATFLLPKTYEASALLLLQESSAGPLGGEVSSPDTVQQKVPGLLALLKSEHVMANALRALRPDISGSASKSSAAAIRDLRESLTIELIGSDFLAIRMRDSESEGLGRRLSIVLSSFLQALLFEPRQNATQLVLARQQKEIDDIEQVRAQAEQKLQSLRNRSPDRSHAELLQNDAEYRRLDLQLAAAAKQVASARENYDGILRKYPNLSSSSTPGILTAPGRIQVVDQPQDPKLPVKSRLSFFLSGIAAGIVLAFALAWAAEVLDPTIYDREALVSASGLPLLAVLPSAERTGSATHLDSTKGTGRGVVPSWVRPVALLLLIAGLGFGITYDGSLPTTVRDFIGWTSAGPH